MTRPPTLPAPPTLGYAGRLPATATNGAALASFVCGLLLFVPFLSGAGAVAFGLMGLRSSRKTFVRGRGLAVAGIVLGCVNLLGSAALIPVALHQRELARRQACLANLRQVGVAVIMYANENRGYLPPLMDSNYLGPYFGGSPVPSCSTGQAGYTYVAPLTRMARVPNASAYVLAYDPPSNHRDGGMGVVYADGHAEWHGAVVAQKILSELNAGQNPPRPQVISPASAGP